MTNTLQEAIEKECASFYVIDDAARLLNGVLICVLFGKEICGERENFEIALQNVIKIKPKELQIIELREKQDIEKIEEQFERIKNIYAAENGMILNLNFSFIFMMHDPVFSYIDVIETTDYLEKGLRVMSGAGFQWDNLSYYGILDKIGTEHKNTNMDYTKVFQFITEGYRKKCCTIVYHPEITLLFDFNANLRATAMRMILDMEGIAKDKKTEIDEIDEYPWFSLRLCEQRLPEQWVCCTLKKMVEKQWITDEAVDSKDYEKQKEIIRNCLENKIEFIVNQTLSVEEKAINYLPLYCRKTEVIITKQEENKGILSILGRKKEKIERKEETELKLFQRNQIETFLNQNYQKPIVFIEKKEEFFRDILKQCTKIIGEETIVAETLIEIFQQVLEEINFNSERENFEGKGQTILDYLSYHFGKEKAKSQQELQKQIIIELKEILNDSSSQNPVRKIVRELLSYHTTFIKGLDNLLYSRYGGENPFIAEKSVAFDSKLLSCPEQLCAEINHHILKEVIKTIIDEIDWKSITEFLVASKEKIASRNGIVGDVFKPGVSAGSPMYYYFTSKEVKGVLPIVGMEVICEPVFREHTLQLLSSTAFSSPRCLTDYYQE